MEEAVERIDQDEDREDGAVVGISAGSDECEAKTQGNPHRHPARRQERTKGPREMSRQCGTKYERWSGDMPRGWKTGRLAQRMIALYVMVMDEVTSQIKRCADGQLKKLVAARVTNATWKRCRRKTKRSCGGW